MLHKYINCRGSLVRPPNVRVLRNSGNCPEPARCISSSATNSIRSHLNYHTPADHPHGSRVLTPNLRAHTILQSIIGYTSLDGSVLVCRESVVDGTKFVPRSYIVKIDRINVKSQLVHIKQLTRLFLECRLFYIFREHDSERTEDGGWRGLG